MQTAFLKLVAANIQQRFGNDLSEIAIVFNNKRPITYLKKKSCRCLWTGNLVSPVFYYTGILQIIDQ